MTSNVADFKAKILVDTAYGDDRLVPNGGNSQCSIQLAGAYTHDVDVRLSEDNSTGGSVNIDEPMDFTLPANKDPVPFALTGIIASEAVNDVLLTVKDPENLSAGEAKAMVYSFGNPALGITPKKSYRLGPIVDPDTGRIIQDPHTGAKQYTYQPDGGHAVDIVGSLEVKPHGVLGTRISGTHIALVQNAMGDHNVNFTHVRPVQWGRHPDPPNASYGPGDTVEVPATFSILNEIPVWTPDGDSGAYPQLAADSYVAMRGGDDLAQVSASDSPNVQFYEYYDSVFGDQGVAEVKERYGRPSVVYNMQFQDWLVTYQADAPSTTMTYWAEATWNLITPEGGATPLMAKLGASSIPPTDTPTMPLQTVIVANQNPPTTSYSGKFTETHP